LAASAAIKPVVTGFDPGSPIAIQRNCSMPWVRPPTDPTVSAAGASPRRYRRRWRRGERAIRSDSTPWLISAAVRSLVNKDMLFIEGIGGIMVPIDETRTVL
jgi:dethiobiotin synthetase